MQHNGNAFKQEDSVRSGENKPQLVMYPLTRQAW